MNKERHILSSRASASLVSSWTEYLTVRNLQHGQAILEICQNEVIGEWYNTDDDGNELEVPDMWNGQRVVGYEDGFLLSETLRASDEYWLEYTAGDITCALSWINQHGFRLTQARAALERFLFCSSG